MSTALQTRLCQYGHEDCHKHMNAQQVILKLPTEPEPSPVLDLLDSLEGLPLVVRHARIAAGMNERQAAEQMHIHSSTLHSIEHGAEFKASVLMAVLDWLGPMSREEWEQLRWADVPPPPMTREELLCELRIVMRGTDDRHEIARRVGYNSAESLSRRLFRMGYKQLAHYLQHDTHKSAVITAAFLEPV